MEHNTRGTDGDDFLEDAADRQGDDGGALEQGEFCGDHAEGECAWDEEQEEGFGHALFGDEDVEARDYGGGLLGEEGDGEERDEHDGGEEEEGCEGVGGCGMAEKEDLCECPAEAGEEGGGHGEGEAEGVEGGFAIDHQEDADGHGEDDGDEFDRGGFEAEEEGEGEDKDEDGRFAHGVECECYVSQRGVAEADVERGGGAGGHEAGEVEVWCEERLGSWVEGCWRR